MTVTQIPVPKSGFEGTSRYSIRPREKRAFNSVLDAAKIIAAGDRPESVVTIRSDGNDVLFEADHRAMMSGLIREEVRYSPTGEGLVLRSLSRLVVQAEGQPARTELVHDFHHEKTGLPFATYPEVTLPFLLGWFPLDGKRRSLYAWINDRFVAKVYLESAGRSSLTLPIGTREAIEVVMYPDLNDWVSLGSVLSRLAKPFIPKYHMWFEPAAPHGLLRFEGPYGPPGAPEIVLELTGRSPA
jgi:hypothetical protein